MTPSPPTPSPITSISGRIILFQQYFIHCSILDEIRQQTRSILAVSLHQRQNEQIEILWNH